MSMKIGSRMWKVSVLVIVYMAIEVQVEGSQDVMKTMFLNYAKALDACKKKMNLPDSVDADFNNFWKPDYEVTDRFTGCAFTCLFVELDLLCYEGFLNHDNAQDFAKKHGADEAMAKQLVDILHECGKSSLPNDDVCVRALNIAKCFKREIHKLNWAPDLDLVDREFLADI